MTQIRSVVLLTYHFPPEVGGIQTRISKYIETLTARGILVTVVLAGKRPARVARWRGAEVVTCNGGLDRLPRNLRTITRCIIHSHADVVHVFTGASTLLGASAMAVGKLAGVRGVMSIFGREDVALLHFADRAVLRASAKMAYAIDVNSAATGSLLPETFHNKVRILLGGADQPSSSVTGEPLPGPSVLFVGRLTARKGVDDLLRAFAVVRDSFPHAILVIVGDGPERDRLTRLMVELGIQHSVEFKGTLLGSDLEKEYVKSTVVVLASKDVPGDTANEGLGLALVEASMYGKPLIGTRHGGISDIVKDGENGFLVPPGNPQILAGAISEILRDGSLAARMGDTSRRLALSQFSWDRATDRLLESYTWRDTRRLEEQC